MVLGGGPRGNGGGGTCVERDVVNYRKLSTCFVSIFVCTRTFICPFDLVLCKFVFVAFLVDGIGKLQPKLKLCSKL